MLRKTHTQHKRTSTHRVGSCHLMKNNNENKGKKKQTNFALKTSSFRIFIVSIVCCFHSFSLTHSLSLYLSKCISHIAANDDARIHYCVVDAMLFFFSTSSVCVCVYTGEYFTLVHRLHRIFATKNISFSSILNVHKYEMNKFIQTWKDRIAMYVCLCVFVCTVHWWARTENRKLHLKTSLHIWKWNA